MQPLNFSITIKTKVFFGENILLRLERDCFPPSVEKVLVVCGETSALKCGYYQKLRNRLKQLGIEVFFYNKITANPKVEAIDGGVNLARELRVDMIIGLGGGSAMDAAKVIAAMYYAAGTTREILLGQRGLPPQRLPLMQIPTTAGTGSELSRGAILTDKERGIKAGIHHELLLADLAVVDPTLTYSMPKALTMETGFDVLCHGIETYLSLKSNPFTELLSLKAIKAVLDNLPRLIKNIDDKEARREMSFASMIMGINLANSSTCLPHRLQYPIGALTETSHGAGLAALYIPWLKLCKLYNQERLSNLVKNLSLQKTFVSVDSFIDEVEKLIKAAGLNKTLSSLGITEAMIPILKSKISGPLTSDPVSEAPDAIAAIYRESLKNL